MNPVIDSELKTLSLALRIQLVEDIWDVIARDSGAVWPLTDAQRLELERRVVLHERTPEEGKSLDQIFARHNLALWPGRSNSVPLLKRRSMRAWSGAKISRRAWVPNWHGRSA